MSSFVVSNATINATVHLLDLDAACCPRGSLGMQLLTDSGPRDQGDVWGEQLQALNLAATNYRYAHHNEPQDALPFRWSPKQYDLITMLKAAECWSYQCQEGDQFTNSEIWQRVEKAISQVQSRIISELPQYRDTAWDLEEDRLCIASDKAKFSDAYKLQSEVCRVLATEPAGEVVTVTKDAYRGPSAAEQLATDVNRNGGNTNEGQMAYMIRLAERHHQAMEDYCNGTVDLYDDEEELKPAFAELRRKIVELAKANGCAGVHFQGNPRGCTVKLILKNGETNDWGKEGWCVPTQGWCVPTQG